MDRITLFRTTPRIVRGPGAIGRIAQEVQELGAKKVLIVTDKGLFESGLTNVAREVLEKGGIKYAVFDGVEPEPRYEIVADCVDKIRSEAVDLVIGFGGGSSMDITKASAMMARNEGPVTRYLGIDLVPEPGLPTLMVPTTAGTASEVTAVAVLTDEGDRLKKAIISSRLFPAVALLDPELTLGLPPHLTASTGMDALTHAIEAFTSVNATDMTDMFAIRAMDLLYNNIRTAYANGKNLEARSRMMEGSLMAGMAFANAGVTAVHAFAYPIGVDYHIPHGAANALMLPHIMRFNLLGDLPKFAGISEAFGLMVEELDDLQAAERAVEAVERLEADLRIPMRLTGFGAEEKDIPALAEGAMKATAILANNPRIMKLEDAKEIYRKAL